ncbi:hypothetical protein [Microbacterium sp. che218]|uniref:hypothetical protein n=1 Tax=Microbacterium sp. che218 TaxID=3140649 RepID=UPI0033697E7F
MTPVAKITVSLAALALLAGITACAPTPASAPAAVETSTPTPEKTPSLAERSLPQYVPDGSLWLVYPHGFQCESTEGCPNNFVAAYGTPSYPLPEGVEYYEPAKHDYDRATNSGMVFSADPGTRYCNSNHMPPLGTKPFDQGAQKGAMGKVELVDGVPTSYTVADNDSAPSRSANASASTTSRSARSTAATSARFISGTCSHYACSTLAPLQGMLLPGRSIESDDVIVPASCLTLRTRQRREVRIPHFCEIRTSAVGMLRNYCQQERRTTELTHIHEPSRVSTREPGDRPLLQQNGLHRSVVKLMIEDYVVGTSTYELAD